MKNKNQKRKPKKKNLKKNKQNKYMHNKHKIANRLAFTKSFYKIESFCLWSTISWE